MMSCGTLFFSSMASNSRAPWAVKSFSGNSPRSDRIRRRLQAVLVLRHKKQRRLSFPYRLQRAAAGRGEGTWSRRLRGGPAAHPCRRQRASDALQPAFRPGGRRFRYCGNRARASGLHLPLVAPAAEQPLSRLPRSCRCLHRHRGQRIDARGGLCHRQIRIHILLARQVTAISRFSSIPGKQCTLSGLELRKLPDIIKA